LFRWQEEEFVAHQQRPCVEIAASEESTLPRPARRLRWTIGQGTGRPGAPCPLAQVTRGGPNARTRTRIEFRACQIRSSSRDRHVLPSNGEERQPCDRSSFVAFRKKSIYFPRFKNMCRKFFLNTDISRVYISKRSYNTYFRRGQYKIHFIYIDTYLHTNLGKYGTVKMILSACSGSARAWPRIHLGNEVDSSTPEAMGSMR
jgi:hypothetical protein